MHVGKQQGVAQVLRPLYPHGRPGRSSWFGSTQLGGKPVGDRPLSLPQLLSAFDFQLNTSLNKNKYLSPKYKYHVLSDLGRQYIELKQESALYE